MSPSAINPRQSGGDVDGIATCEQRARRRSRDRHRKGDREGGPDQGRPERFSSTLNSNSVIPAEERSAPRGWWLSKLDINGAQKHRLEHTTVIGEMAMRLAEGGDDLRHLQTEHAVRVGERGPVTALVALVSFGRVRPDLDALPGKRRPIAGTAHGARHPEAPATDPVHDRRAREVVVGARPASYGWARGFARGRAPEGRKPR